jgi:hypothetical protein
MTKGEYRVGVNFNPGGHSQVDGVKQITAGLIDEMEHVKTTSLDNAEATRCAEIAQEHFETAAMWAVKAITKPQEDA